MIFLKNNQLFFCFFMYFQLLRIYQALPDLIRIGGLFDTEDEEQELAFRIAVDAVNSDPEILMGSRLIAQIERLQPDDSYGATEKFCSLLQTGIAAVFGPQSQTTSLHIRSMCDALEIPHVLTRWEYQLQRDDISINVYPHPRATSQSFIQLVDILGWKEFLYVYEEDQGAIRLQDFFFVAEANNYKMKVYQFLDHNYRDVFWEMKAAKNSEADKDGVHHRIILDVTRQNLYSVMKAAQQVGMMTEKQAYIITSLDLHSIDIEDFQFGKTNITALSLILEEGDEFMGLLKEVNRRLARRRNQPELTTLRTESALIYDAVKLFALALKEIDAGKNVAAFAPISCNRMNKGTDGTSLTNYMKSAELIGVTGQVKFDAEGFRSELSLGVLQLTERGLVNIGHVVPGGNANVSRHESPKEEYKELEHRLYIVTTYVKSPYMMLKESSDALVGNNKYEGYGYDLLNGLSKILHFRFELREVADGEYGKPVAGQENWNGMIGEIQTGVADMALADLTINSQREEVVDFTMPFINTGISILYEKPTQKSTSLFTFLLPFSGLVWIFVIGALLMVSVIIFIIGRLSPYEWNNPHPCRQTDQVEENCFSLLDSLWFTFGSLMQQGSDVAPVASSTRTIASIWYFFNLIMISSYTANLAAFLTVESIISPFESAEDLAKQEIIKYGCYSGGSTYAFFQNSTITTYKSMHAFMKKHEDKGVFPSTYTQAKEKVRKGKYAYFTEASSIEYTIERECDLTQIGGLLDNKGYGIAIKKNNSKLQMWLSGGILKLQEDGLLHTFKERWWKQKRGGGKCAESAKGGSSVAELGLGNVGGVFVVMMLGLTLAGVVATLEFLWYSRKLERHDEEPLLKMLLKELKFAVSCGDSEKPTPKLKDRKRKSSSRDE